MAAKDLDHSFTDAVRKTLDLTPPSEPGPATDAPLNTDLVEPPCPCEFTQKINDARTAAHDAKQAAMDRANPRRF